MAWWKTRMKIHPVHLQKISIIFARIAPDFFSIKLKNPIFIIGCGRSGSTLLVDTLADHPDIANYPDEANELWHPQTFPWRTSKYRNNIPPIEVDSRKYTQLSLKYRSSAETRHLRAVFGAFQMLMGRRVFLNKSAMITFMLPYILDLFPEAKFIHLVRDGRAVALSWAKKVKQIIESDMNAYETAQLSTAFDDLLLNCSRSWNEHIQEIELQKEALGLERRGKIIEIRYEDFCANPLEHLLHMADYIGISPEPYLIKDLSHISSTNYKFKKELDENLYQRICALMTPALQAKNYQ